MTAQVIKFYKRLVIMNKYIKLIFLITLLGIQMYAKADTASSVFKKGVLQYKQENYIGCMQSMKQATSIDPGNITAHYYLAISLVRLGDRNTAINEYKKVIKLSPNSGVAALAKIGLKNVGYDEQENKPKQTPVTTETKNTPPITAATKPSPDPKPVHKQVPTMSPLFDGQTLPGIPSLPEIPAAKKKAQYKELFDENENKTTQEQPVTTAEKQPSAEEIAKAIKILSQSGLMGTNLMGTSNANPEMMQMNMLMGSMGGMGGNNNNGNNSFNMLPLLMMSQNSGGKIDPQVMQSAITNMMMPGMFNMNGDSNSNY